MQLRPTQLIVAEWEAVGAVAETHVDVFVDVVAEAAHGAVAEDALESAGMRTAKSAQVRRPSVSSRWEANVAHGASPAVAHTTRRIVVEADEQVFVVGLVSASEVVLNRHMFLAYQERV